MEEKQINGQTYKLPGSLNQFQEKMYIHLIDWKRQNISRNAGVYKSIEYDAILPYNVREDLPLIYCPIKEDLKKHREKYKFKFHQHFHHMASSQAANINLFLPILLSPCANDVLRKMKDDFKYLATKELYKGFRIEFWDGSGNEIGLLKDHSMLSGTDSDIGIAYYNHKEELCLWLIEHKLTENEFTTCGGFRSKRRDKCVHLCEKSFSEIISNKKYCFHHDYKDREYWNLTSLNISFFVNSQEHTSCPFKGGMNQLWRNQLLGFALEKAGVFKSVYFSVVKHPDNNLLEDSINQYKKLIENNGSFSVLNSDIAIRAAEAVGNSPLNEWVKWYKELYRID